jgi:hypothetical protein
MKKNLFSCCLVLLFASCSTEGNIQQILGTTVQAPVFLDCRSVSSGEIIFSFSDPVRVVSLNFDTALGIESIEEGRELRVTLADKPGEGKKIVADILVEDSNRNSLNVIVPFRTRNNRMPALVLNEIRTEYTKPRLEFVEFLALESGNLGAMRFFIAGHSLTTPVYEFPPAEVNAGEYIVLHLRTAEEGCVDETGTNLALSSGYEAQDDARDFWIPGSSKLIHKSDALWLMDQDNRILDAVMLYDNPKDWDKYASAAAEFLGLKKAWLPLNGDAGVNWIPNSASAVISTGTTATRTICRDQDLPPGPRAGNWYITANSSATPGKRNNPKRYAP